MHFPWYIIVLLGVFIGAFIANGKFRLAVFQTLDRASSVNTKQCKKRRYYYDDKEEDEDDEPEEELDDNRENIMGSLRGFGFTTREATRAADYVIDNCPEKTLEEQIRIAIGYCDKIKA